VLKVHLHNLASELPGDHEGLGHANAGVERMHHLVEQILDLNRTNPELIRGNFEQLDLHRLARQVSAEYWPAFCEKNQTVSMQGEPATMAGDPVMLETLLGNLLANANKYTPQGGEILVSVSSNSDGVELVVEDSGPGVAPEERERVFERFYRASGSVYAEATGSGLGLAIVKHICQLHGANIALQGSDLGGLKVVVNFPAGVVE
jgi:two-component system sensor histidine kinase QseC